MSVVYSTTLKNTRMDAVDTAVGSSGFLVIGTSSLAAPSTGILVKIPLSTPAFGDSAAGVLTLSGLPLSETATGAGTAAKAEIWTSANAVVVSGLTVGTESADIILGTTTIAIGNTINITSGSITHG